MSELTRTNRRISIVSYCCCIIILLYDQIIAIAGIESL